MPLLPEGQRRVGADALFPFGPILCNRYTGFEGFPQSHVICGIAALDNGD